MKICKEYASLLDAFLDGELSVSEEDAVRAHLAACPACAAYVADALAIRAAFEDLEEIEVPAGLADGVMAAIRANAAPRKKAHRGLKTLASLAACAAIVFAAVQVLPFDQDSSGGAPMAAMAGGGAAMKSQAGSDAADVAESGVSADSGEANDAPHGESFLLREGAASSAQDFEAYGAAPSDGAEASEEAPSSFLLTQANEGGGAASDGTVFAGVAYLPPGQRLSALLEGREGKPYSADGVSGTGYAMTPEELTSILNELGAEPEISLNAGKTTELYCLVVTDSR